VRDIRDIKAAVVGTGFIGVVHVEALRRLGIEVTGIVGSTPERAAAKAQAAGLPAPYPSFEAMLDDPTVEVVHLTTPNRLHFEEAKAALAAGKHVVCEKPLAIGAGTAERLVAAAAAAGKVATVPFVYRFHPLVREARARIAGGSLGPVRLIHGGYLQDWLASAEDDNWRVDSALGGPSRAFADIGSHWCDLVEFLTGDRIAALCAQAATIYPERADRGSARAFEQSGAGGGARRAVGTEDAVTALFRTHGDAQGTLIVSQVSPGRKNHLHVELACAEASVRFEQERPEPLWIGRREGGESVWRDSPQLASDAGRLTLAPAGHAQGYLDCFDLFVADTYAAIGGAEPEGLPTFADGSRSARIVDAVLASTATGDWVDL
jgi:predicted dehydrogenase